MKREMKKLNNEAGVTLVELLAAITVLSIVITAFLGFFIQAARTNQHTNKINEATFLAQEQMESIIHLAPERPPLLEYDKNNYSVETEFGPGPGNHLETVTVIVREGKMAEGGKVRAKMQTILSYESEDVTEESIE